MTAEPASSNLIAQLESDSFLFFRIGPHWKQSKTTVLGPLISSVSPFPNVRSPPLFTRAFHRNISRAYLWFFRRTAARELGVLGRVNSWHALPITLSLDYQTFGFIACGSRALASFSWTVNIFNLKSLILVNITGRSVYNRD